MKDMKIMKLLTQGLDCPLLHAFMVSHAIGMRDVWLEF